MMKAEAMLRNNKSFNAHFSNKDSVLSKPLHAFEFRYGPQKCAAILICSDNEKRCVDILTKKLSQPPVYGRPNIHTAPIVMY